MIKLTLKEMETDEEIKWAEKYEEKKQLKV